LTFWLKLDAAQGLTRSRHRGALDRMEQANLEFHQQVQQGFETLAERNPARIVTIDAAASEDTVALQIQTLMEQKLKAWYRKHLPTS
jgi:dTMP kinase